MPPPSPPRSQAMIRARMLRENCKYIPEQSFLMRRHFFNNDDSGEWVGQVMSGQV